MKPPPPARKDEDVSSSPEKFKTPVKTSRKPRRRQDGTLVVPLNEELPQKTIYLIRHGQSQGQAAQQNGLDRVHDESLRDCGLTAKGQGESMEISSFFSAAEFESIQLVLSSPLTRALHTALLAFPTKDILVHFDLREVSAKTAPENNPREMKDVLNDLSDVLKDRDKSLSLDVTSLQPSHWPRDFSPSVIKRERIRRVFQWLYQERNESVVAVVCHYNVMRTAVIDGDKLRPRNATPIRCDLYSNGELIIKEPKKC